MSELKKRYPRSVECEDGSVELELLADLDTDEVKAFSEQLNVHDLLFLSRDIREPKVIEAWSRSIAEGEIVSVAARRNGEIVGVQLTLRDISDRRKFLVDSKIKRGLVILVRNPA